jgi:hypothetical protein
MIYFTILIISLLIFTLISQFIEFPSIKERIFHFFIQQVSVITLIISIFAIIVTGGKSIFFLFIPMYIFLLWKKHLIFSIPSKKEVIYTFRHTLLIIPIVLIQFLLHFDLKVFTPFLPSDDILLYSGFSNSIVQFGNENRYEALNFLYPQLFSGISPYHFYEIWFTSLIGHITGKSYSFILLLVVYPYLVWLTVLGISSVMEHVFKHMKIKHYIFLFLFLFIGPVYIRNYEFIFNDGNFFESTVFTITGFAKQTLPFSYYGQKHLPVYIFCIMSFLFLLKYNYKLFIIVGLFMSVCAFGTIIGVFGAFCMLFIFENKMRQKENIMLICLTSIAFLLIIVVFKMGINNEISQKTLYLNDFLKHLNLKGEITRFATKIAAPLVWFSILYLPFIVITLIYKKNIFNNLVLKILALFLIFSFEIGSISLSLFQGMNSDQFLTNLLPIFNVIIIIALIHLLKIENTKNITRYFVIIISAINAFFLFSFHQTQQNRIDECYSSETMMQVTKQLKKEKTNPIIAYILHDSIVKKYPPLIWYPHKPGKVYFLKNYCNMVNINYPYERYERNSASIAFSAENQMRFFLHGNFVPKEKFGAQQKSFLTKKSIKWLFCSKGVKLSPQIESMVEKKFEDKLSGEIFYRLKKN